MLNGEHTAIPDVGKKASNGAHYVKTAPAPARGPQLITPGGSTITAMADRIAKTYRDGRELLAAAEALDHISEDETSEIGCRRKALQGRLYDRYMLLEEEGVELGSAILHVPPCDAREALVLLLYVSCLLDSGTAKEAIDKVIPVLESLAGITVESLGLGYVCPDNEENDEQLVEKARALQKTALAVAS